MSTAFTFNNQSYDSCLTSFKRKISRLDFTVSNALGKRFACFLGNLQHFLPRRRSLNHCRRLFEDFTLRQYLSHMDQLHPLVPEAIGPQNLRDLQKIFDDPEPCIICTYHTGSYRLLNRLLMEQGVRFELLVSSEVLNEEAQLYQNLYERYAPEENAGNFATLDAHAPHALLKMIRALNAGKKLVVYVDGNTGVGRADLNRNHLSLNFLNQRIRVRKGIASLAYMTGYPIQPILCRRPQLDRLDYLIQPVIRAQADEGRLAFEQRAMGGIYRDLEAHIRSNPSDWDGWLFAHEQLDR